MHRMSHCWFRVTPLALALGLALCPRPGRAQPVVGGQGFKFAEYYDPPHETQMKSLLEGAGAQRQADGRIEVTQAKWRTFRESGAGEMTVEAPECVYSPSQKSISSAGPLRVQTADGRFSIAGEGFLFQQTNSMLLVSNRVHTVIHPELLRPQPAAATNAETAQAPGIEVFSDQFEYAQKAGQGVYRGNVHVVGTNLSATAGKLTVLLPVAERRLQSLTAEQNVIVDYEKIHATGDRAIYLADTGLAHLTGQPSWRIEQREGAGDELVFDQTNRVFRANGHARLRMPAQNMAAPGLLSRPAADSSGASTRADHFVEILCDSYELRTNLAVFRQDVRVSDRLGEKQQGELTCGVLTLTLTGTNELQRIVAEPRVVIGQEDGQFTADRAEYTATNGVLDLIGNPAWRAGLREGTGDLIRVQPARKEMLVRGNAVMKLPAAELGRSAFTALGQSKRGGAKSPSNDSAEIYSREYFLSPESALFRGGVRIEHPQMNWSCEEVTLLSTAELGKDSRVLIAEPAVVFDVVDDQGRGFHGTGDKAVYTHRITPTMTNDLVELTGKPAMLAATNLVGRNQIITLDLANHRLIAPGRYKLWGTGPAPTATTFQLPKTKLTR
jgi:lipopolysaccharide transport protein LptA